MSVSIIVASLSSCTHIQQIGYLPAYQLSAWVSMWYPGGMVGGMNMAIPGMMMVPGQPPYGTVPYYMPNGNGAVNTMGVPIAGQEGQASSGSQANQAPLTAQSTGPVQNSEAYPGMMMSNLNFASNGYPYPVSSFPFEQSFSLQTPSNSKK